MNQELQDKIDRLKELIPLATQEPWNLIQKYDEWENYVGPESWADMGQNICVCKYSRDADYIFAANPQIILEIITELETVQMHEHYMIQWAELDKEESFKTLAWMHELQGILGLKQEVTKNSRAEIIQKVQELVQKELKNEKSD